MLHRYIGECMYQQLMSILISKNLPLGINQILLSQCEIVFVNMSNIWSQYYWPFYTTLIIYWFYLFLKVIAWYIDLSGIKNKNIFKSAYHSSLKKEMGIVSKDIQTV